MTRRISCTRCDKTFSKMEHLNRHKLAPLDFSVDTGERPYKCTICVKSFARRDVLLRHRRSHSDGNSHTNDLTKSRRRNISHKIPSDPLDEARIDVNGGKPPSSVDRNRLDIPLAISESINNFDFTQGQLQNCSDTAIETDDNFIDMLFDSHFALPFPLNAMSTGDQLSSENDLIENNAEVCLSGNPSLQPDSQTRAALRAQKAWSKSSTYPIQQVDIWHEVRSASVANIFHSQNTTRDPFQIDDITSACESSPSEINLTDATKERLKALKRNILTCDCSNLFDRDSICDKGYLCRNTTEIFDQGFYLYTHKYQPAYPIAHLATLNTEKVPDILLFVICMIGISLLKTEDAIAFIRTTYPHILDEAFSQFISIASDCHKSIEIPNSLVLAHHVLFLFLSTGGKICNEKSKIFYIYTLTTACRFDLFYSTTDEHRCLSSRLHTSGLQGWQAWARVESMKNLTIGLLLHDSWLSELFSMHSIIQPTRLKLILPFKDNLYQAAHHREWIELITQYPDTPGAFELSNYTFSLPHLDGPVHAFSFYGILCSVLLRTSGDINRLVTNSHLRSVTKHHHIPWEICRLDRRAIITVPLLTQIISLYENTLRESNPNCIVIWHCICILISVDINVLARAAGQNGPGIMKTTRQELIDWTNTPASRRACIHSAQIFRVLSHRKPADGTAFQSVRALFMSAMVLGLYLLVKPPSFDTENENVPFDLSEANIDWKNIREEGFSQASENTGSDDVAIQFIRFGGPIVLNGKKYECGVRHAKRIILEFAGLLDEIGSHWMDDYAQLLYIIHDTIE